LAARCCRRLVHDFEDRVVAEVHVAVGVEIEYVEAFL
jgi:hypothetical protein